MVNEVRRGGVWLFASLVLAVPASLGAQVPDCKERCAAARQRAEARLKRCLAATADLPRAQAARYRVKCRRQNTAPRCDGLPTCPPKAKPKQHKAGLVLGPVVFSTAQRGPAVARPSYTPGKQIFVRLQVTFTSKPDQRRLWLQLDLRLLAQKKKGKPIVVASWPKYLQKQKFLELSDRHVPLPYTLHGGALLPPDFKAGVYVAEVTVKERTAGFAATTQGSFRVAGAYRPLKKAETKKVPKKVTSKAKTKPESKP